MDCSSVGNISRNKGSKSKRSIGEVSRSTVAVAFFDGTAPLSLMPV